MNWQVERKDGSLNILFRVHAKMRGWLALCRMDQLLLLAKNAILQIIQIQKEVLGIQ